jgi:dCMP deaminase
MTESEAFEWMRVAYQKAMESPDLSTKNGAVLIDTKGQLAGIGCNRIVPECCKTDERLQRPLKYEWTRHAEIDAIMDAVKDGYNTVGGTLVAAWAACAHCGTVIVGSGVKRVIRHRHEYMDRRPDWQKSIAVADEMFAAAGIDVVELRGKVGVKILFNGELVEV